MFHQLDVLHEGRIVRIRRSERPFASAFELHIERRRLTQELDAIGRSGRRLLVDSRAAPHSTDEHLQEEFQRFRVDVARGFERIATLVRTKVAILQVRRLSGAQAWPPRAFDDEAAAIAYLLDDTPRESKREKP